MENTPNDHPLDALDGCMFACNIPIELRRIVSDYARCVENLNDSNIRQAVNALFINRNRIYCQYGHISYWNTTGVTAMNGLFEGKMNFNEDISRWNVSNVTTMQRMFCNASTFKQPLSKWNVHNVNDMNGMFFLCRVIQSTIEWMECV